MLDCQAGCAVECILYTGCSLQVHKVGSTPDDVEQPLKGAFKGCYLLYGCIGMRQTNQEEQHFIPQCVHVSHHVHQMNHAHWGSQNGLQTYTCGAKKRSAVVSKGFQSQGGEKQRLY